MGHLLECSFNKVFADLCRACTDHTWDCSSFIDSLADGYLEVITKRVQAGDCTASIGHTLAVDFCLRRHAASKANNGGVCTRDDYHGLLYVAAKIAFIGNINGEALTGILNDIFECKGSFERMFSSGTMPTMFETGEWTFRWVIHFASQEESVEFLKYCVNHSTLAKLDYLWWEGRRISLVDLLLESIRLPQWNIDGWGTFRYPVDVTFWRHNISALVLLLRHGAVLDVDDEGYIGRIESLVRKLYAQFRKRNVRSISECEGPIVCVKLLFATVPQVKLDLREDMDETEFRSFLAAFPFLPASRCGLEPPELKHLARCKVREALNRNWKLPLGIDELKVPESVKKYLDLGDARPESL